ncbi:hypothetical protein PHSC3_000987 [Chlamydiales bacterium STE3]|nr:hypothetical protein PHSC3_000987 [Chlamydiales bacterium STE3]
MKGRNLIYNFIFGKWYYMAMSGSSLTEIGILLGHKRLEVTKRYAHLSQKHLSEAVEKMNEGINLAEEALRSLVVARKLCFDSRSEYDRALASRNSGLRRNFA